MCWSTQVGGPAEISLLCSPCGSWNTSQAISFGSSQLYSLIHLIRPEKVILIVCAILCFVFSLGVSSIKWQFFWILGLINLLGQNFAEMYGHFVQY